MLAFLFYCLRSCCASFFRWGVSSFLSFVSLLPYYFPFRRHSVKTMFGIESVCYRFLWFLEILFYIFSAETSLSFTTQQITFYRKLFSFFFFFNILSLVTAWLSMFRLIHQLVIYTHIQQNYLIEYLEYLVHNFGIKIHFQDKWPHCLLKFLFWLIGRKSITMFLVHNELSKLVQSITNLNN